MHRLIQPSDSMKEAGRKVRPVSLQAPPGLKPQSGSYLDFVKQRAIAGAMAGDWCTGRELPEIPSTLLSKVQPTIKRVYSEEDVVNLCSQPASSNVTFALANQSAFSVPVGEEPLRKSPGVIGSKNTVYIPPPMRSQMDARLTAPLISTSMVDEKPTPLVFGTVLKRRLAPTQVTIDSLFPNAAQWRSKFQVKEDLTMDKLSIKEDFTYFSKSPVAKSSLTESIRSASPAVKDSVVQESAAVVRTKIPPPQPSAPSHRLSQRQKQIDIGKNTPEYRNYMSQFPDKNQRRAGDPQTPDKWQDISKRNWEGQMKKWRRTLHQFDPLPEEDKENALDVNGLSLEEGEISSGLVGN